MNATLTVADLARPPTPDPRPFAALDAAIAGLFAAPPHAIEEPGKPLAPGISLQFRGNSGLRATAGGGDAISVALALPIAPIRTHRFLGLRLGGACAAGAVTLRPVLRLVAEDGWRDTDFPCDLVFTPHPADNLALLPLDAAEGRESATAAVLILFVRQRAADLRLLRIDPFCAR
jgi:hypothetical protein